MRLQHEIACSCLKMCLFLRTFYMLMKSFHWPWLNDRTYRCHNCFVNNWMDKFKDCKVFIVIDSIHFSKFYDKIRVNRNCRWFETVELTVYQIIYLISIRFTGKTLSLHYIVYIVLIRELSISYLVTIFQIFSLFR